MILPLLSSLLLAPAAPSQPVDVRAVLIELTLDAKGVSRACDAIESSGSALVDKMACLMVASHGVEVPSGMLPAPGSSATIKWKQRAAMVQFSDGSSRLVVPPERMMRRVFLRRYSEGQRGAMLVERRDAKGDVRSCAFFAPHTVSRFDPANCGRPLSIEEQVTDPMVGKDRPALVWTNVVVAAGDL